MKRSDFVELHGSFCDSLKTITAAKNADYTGASDTPFYNFETVERLKICSTEQGFLTRMTDKLARISSIVATGKTHVKDESVADTLLDLANYSIILACYLRWKKESTADSGQEVVRLIP